MRSSAGISSAVATACCLTCYRAQTHWHAACKAPLVIRPSARQLISVEAFESFARLAGAASLLALCKIGRGSGWHRARQRVSGGDRASRKLRALPGGPSPSPGPAPLSRRERLRLHAIVAGLWIVLSLVLLGYATIEGELALADLDGLDLVATYASSPTDRP